MIEEQNSRNCNGCLACYNICPVNAINIEYDDNGFIIPKVNKSICINCEKCKNVCSSKNKEYHFDVISAYCFYSLDDDVRKTSSSGGAFHCLANNVIKNNGIVYGCVFDKKNRVFKHASSDEYSLEEIQKSKYLESKIGFTYKNVKEELLKGRQVLFCGTPCEVSALKNFLEKDYDNLLLIDFACGGIPSQVLFWKYIHDLEKKYKSKIKNISFRPKMFSWLQYQMLIIFENGKQYSNIAECDPYLGSFLYTGLLQRPCCHECKFSYSHQSDIILADFWKYKDFNLTINNIDVRKGLSLVLCQTDKGNKALLDLNINNVIVKSLNIELSKYNFQKRTLSDENYQKILQYYKDIKQYGLKNVYNSKLSLKRKCYYFIKKLIRITSYKLYR